jgi:hypothetical protein
MNTINNIDDFLDYCRSNNLNTNQIDKIIQTAFKVIIFNTDAIDSESLLTQFKALYLKYDNGSNDRFMPLFFECTAEAIIKELDINCVN